MSSVAANQLRGFFNPLAADWFPAVDLAAAEPSLTARDLRAIGSFVADALLATVTFVLMAAPFLAIRAYAQKLGFEEAPLDWTVNVVLSLDVLLFLIAVVRAAFSLIRALLLHQSLSFAKTHRVAPAQTNTMPDVQAEANASPLRKVWQPAMVSRGREEEIEELVKNLTVLTSQLTAMHGGAGIGKSIAARYYSQHYDAQVALKATAKLIDQFELVEFIPVINEKREVHLTVVAPDFHWTELRNSVVSLVPYHRPEQPFALPTASRSDLRTIASLIIELGRLVNL